MSGKWNDVFELDTKGICLLCLRKCSHSETTTNLSSSPSCSYLSDEEKDKVFQSFTKLMRYLNIDLLQQCNFPPSFLQCVDGAQRDVPMVVKMCSMCLEMCQEFSEVHREFEMIRLQLDECVQGLYQMMQSGDKNNDRQREYQRILKDGKNQWNPIHLFHASIADNLRKETLRKCSLKMKSLIPRVTVSKQNINGSSSNIPKESDLSPVPNTSGSSPPSPVTLCVIKETRSNTNGNEFEVPGGDTSSMLKVEATYSDDAASDHQEIVSLSINHEDDGSKDATAANDPLAHSHHGDPYPSTSWDTHHDNSTSSSSAAGVEERVRRFQCPNKMCNKSFINKETLRIHFKCMHTWDAYFDRLPPGTTEPQLKSALDYCIQYKSITNFSSYSDGHDTNNSVKKIECGFCTKIVRDTFILKIHILDNHFDQLVEALNNPQMIKTAVIAITPKKSKTIAVKRTGSGSNYRTSRGRGGRKIANGYSGPIFKCPICRKEFTVLTCMKRHYKAFHTREGANQYRCTFCNKSFMTGFNMRVHIVAIHVWEANKARVPVGTTEEQLRDTLQRISKEQRKNRNGTKTSMSCNFCNKMFSDACFFKYHMVEIHFQELVARLRDSTNQGTQPYYQPESVYLVEGVGAEHEDHSQLLPSSRLNNFLHTSTLEQILSDSGYNNNKITKLHAVGEGNNVGGGTSSESEDRMCQQSNSRHLLKELLGHGSGSDTNIMMLDHIGEKHHIHDLPSHALDMYDEALD